MMIKTELKILFSYVEFVPINNISFLTGHKFFLETILPPWLLLLFAFECMDEPEITEQAF